MGLYYLLGCRRAQLLFIRDKNETNNIIILQHSCITCNLISDYRVNLKVSINSKIFQWFNCVAYSTLAALLGRMIIFPAGVLGDSEILLRLIVLVTCVTIFLLSKRNLVIPTLTSAIFLSILSNL